VGRDVHLPPPGKTLEKAQRDATFEIRKPSYVPEGMSLFLVNWAPPEPDEGDVRSVGLYYSSSDDRRFHIWQTNNPFLPVSGKPVMGQGRSEEIQGRAWEHLFLPEQRLQVLNRLFPDGVTLSLDGNLGIGEMRRIAASIPD
jgi:hypothetical protein